MDVIEGQNVDLISPFPMQEAKRVYGWMHCYKTFVETDESPKTPEDFEVWFKTNLVHCVSFGVIDKHNQLKINHEAPLIGMFIFEPSGIRGGYCHVASTRKAWGSRLIDQGASLAIDTLFEQLPMLTRLSAVLLSSNTPAKYFAIRLGFKQEGIIKDLFTQQHEPKDGVHLGLTRRQWSKTKWDLTKDTQPQSDQTPANPTPLSLDQTPQLP